MNPFYLIPIVIILVIFAVDQLVRRRAYDHVRELYRNHETQELLDYLDGRYARLLFPAYNRTYLQFNAYEQQGDEKRASEKLDELLAAKTTDEQRSDLLVRAFEFYLAHDKGPQARLMLDRIAEGTGSEEVVSELTKVYEIVAEHSCAYIDEMEDQLAQADEATQKRLHYLLALQYEYAKKPEDARRHRSLMKQGSSSQ